MFALFSLKDQLAPLRGILIYGETQELLTTLFFFIISGAPAPEEFPQAPPRNGNENYYEEGWR